MIETLASLASAAGHDLLAPQIRDEHSLGTAYRGSDLYDIFTDYGSAAGPAVTARTAMCVSAVWACVNLISSGVSGSPCHIYDRKSDTPERVKDHPYWWLLNLAPHKLLSAAVMWEVLIQDLLLNGDMFAVLNRNGAGTITEILPVSALNVNVYRQDNQLTYHIWIPWENVSLVREMKDMIHVPGPGFDGRRGMSAIRYAVRPSAGIALAADEYSGRFFSNGARPEFVLETDGQLSEEMVQKLRDSWFSRYGGVSNSHRPAVLQGGLKAKEISINAEDAQLLTTRQYQVEDIARIFGVPPHMIGLTQKTTSWGSGVETMGSNFVKYCLSGHLTKIKQELSRKLFPRSSFFCEFATAGLERGDTKGRYEAYRMALGGSAGPGFMTQNELRRLENMPAIDGGDELVDWQRTGAAEPGDPGTAAKTEPNADPGANPAEGE